MKRGLVFIALCGAFLSVLSAPGLPAAHDLQDIADFELIYKTWPRYPIYGQEIPILSGSAYPSDHSWKELSPYLDMEFPDRSRRNVSFSTLYVKVVGREDRYTQKEQDSRGALMKALDGTAHCPDIPADDSTGAPRQDALQNMVETSVKSGDSAALAACFSTEAHKQEITTMVADATLVHRKLEALILLRESMDIIHEFEVRKAFGGNIGD